MSQWFSPAQMCFTGFLLTTLHIIKKLLKVMLNGWLYHIEYTPKSQVTSDSLQLHGPGSSVHGISQAKILEWVFMLFSKRSSQPRDRTWVSCNCRHFLYCLSHQGIPILYRERWNWVSKRSFPRGGESWFES